MSAGEQIKNQLKSYIPELKAKYPIDSIAIFGSYARGESTTKSDVDLLVDFSAPMGLRFVDLAEELENILHTKVDLVCRKDLQETFWNNIKNELIYV